MVPNIAWYILMVILEEDIWMELIHRNTIVPVLKSGSLVLIITWCFSPSKWILDVLLMKGVLFCYASFVTSKQAWFAFTQNLFWPQGMFVDTLAILCLSISYATVSSKRALPRACCVLMVQKLCLTRRSCLSWPYVTHTYICRSLRICLLDLKEYQ